MILFQNIKKKFTYPSYWFKIVLGFAITGFIFGSLLYFKASPDFWGGLVGTITFLTLLIIGIKIGNTAVEEATTHVAQHSSFSSKKS